MLRLVLACLLGIACASGPFEREARISVHAIAREDAFEWSIPGERIDVLSELSWENVRSRGAELSTEIPLPFGLLASADAQYARTQSGEYLDSDYELPGRRGEFSRSIGGARGGKFVESSLLLGTPLRAFGSVWIPRAGIAFGLSDLRMRNGRQTVPFEARFGGLDSRYDARWFGPSAGLAVEFPAGRARISLEVAASWIRYRASADLNLREDFAHPESFTHRAHGREVSFSALLSYPISARWTAELSLRGSHLRTSGGLDRLYFSDGSRLKSRFNGASMRSFSISVGVGRAL